MTEPTPEIVIGAYIKTRDELTAKQKALDEELATMKGHQKAREDWLRNKMAEVGTDSFKIKGVGTCFTKRTESVKVSDWDAVLEFVKENDCPELLTKGVNKTVVLERMGENRDQPLPPGVSYTAFADINIRRP